MKLGRAFTVDDTALLSSNVTESEAAWNIVTSYSIGNVVRRTVDSVHRRFISVINSNVGNDPELGDDTKWTDDGSTNRFAQFDQRLQLQTTNPDSIYSKIQVTGRIDAIYVGNISAETLRIVATDAIDGVVHDETYGLISTSRVTDWARYFRERIVAQTDKGLVLPLRGYSDLQIEVTLADPGQTVACGELVLAFMADIGGTQWGGEISNKSYSRIDEDEHGSDFITRRGRKRSGAYGVIVDNRDLDDVTGLLDDADARAVLYIASEAYSAMFLFGLLLGWREVVQWPTRTALSMNIQSFVR